MKKFLAILMALVMTFALATAGATTIDAAGDGDSANAPLSISTGTSASREVSVVEIEVDWGNTAAGSAQVNRRHGKTWDGTTFSWVEGTDWEWVPYDEGGLASYTAPVLQVTVVNRSSPGHVATIAMESFADEYADSEVYSGDSVATQIASDGLASFTLTAGTGDASTRTRAKTFSIVLDEEAIYNDVTTNVLASAGVNSDQYYTCFLGVDVVAIAGLD